MITINYLPNDRTHYFKTIFNQLIKIKDENKKKINVNILVSKDGDENIDEKLLTDNGIETQVIFQPHLGRHYMGKVEKGIEESDKYSVSLDEDVFINNHIWDFMIENCDVLDSDENILMSPLLSTGIPTVDWFIDGVLDDEDKNTMYDIFKTLRIGEHNPNEPIPPGCQVLNEHTIFSDKWDYEKWYEGVFRLDTHYKGVHPIRILDSAQQKMLEFCLKYKSKLLEKRNYELFKVKFRPYFNNNVYMIKTSTWEKIVYDSSLFVDKFDEVPLNRYRLDNNLNMIFIKNGFGVHPSFNWIGMDRYTEISDTFFEQIDKG